MKIKRTFAPTMREALNIVKQEQGDDAVILGNNKVPGGVEIISAIDYDQAKINAQVQQQARQSKKLRSRSTQTPVSPPPVVKATQSPKADIIKPVFAETAPIEQRHEPVLGDLAEEPFSKPALPTTMHNASLAQTNKESLDWTQIIANEQAASSETTDFNGAAHAEELLNTIKELQVQLAQKNKAETEKLKPQKTNTQQTEVMQASTTSKQQFTVDKQTNNDNSSQQSVNSVQPAIEEMKEEMKNLRQIMQSQLTALDWNHYKQRNPLRVVLLNLLTELGIGSDVCERILNQMDIDHESPQHMWRHAMGVLSKTLPIQADTLLERGGVYALVGSTGVGKTTTIAKLAARFAHIHGKRSVALVSTDNFRVGAQEQLQQYAKLLEIPLLTANSSEELADCLTMLSDKRLVLIDTAGMSQNDMKLSEQFHTLHKGSPDIQPLLVLSANTQLAALNQTIDTFEKVRLAGAIVTKVDEAASLGGVMTAAIRHHLPIHFCGLGQQVPEDLEVAKSHRLISKAVALMQHYKETPNSETMAMRFQNIVSFG